MAQNHKMYILTASLIFLCFGACKNKSINYINYYNDANKIDSVFTAHNDTLQTIKNYQKLFGTYKPKNINQSKDYEKLIKLTSAFDPNYNLKNNLETLRKINAPKWNYKKNDKELLEIYKKNDLDNTAITQNRNDENGNIRENLADSLKVVFKRYKEAEKAEVFSKADQLNEQFLNWTFKKYGYPSSSKIEFWYQQKEYIPISQLLFRMTLSPNFNKFKDKILGYVKSGDCHPEDYAQMIDKHNLENNKESSYGFFIKNIPIKDTIVINQNRKLIGIKNLTKNEVIPGYQP